MDYYEKKYQKYKLKYLNLLNQYGGVSRDKELTNLVKLLNIKNKFDNEEKKKIINKLIVLKLPERVKNILLKLNEKQLDILLTVTKINILNSKNIYDINSLIINYDYLLNKDITDIIIIDAVKKYFNTFLLIPEEIMTDAIIKKAIEQDVRVLKYVPQNKKTFEICKLAVKNNGLALQFILENNAKPIFLTLRQYNIICELAVKNNGLALKFVPRYKKDFDICKVAVKQNGRALQYVLSDMMSPEQYYEICKLAVNNNGTALQFVQSLIDFLTLEMSNSEDFLSEQSAYWLAVQSNKMSKEQYYILSLEALQHLDNMSISNEDIYKTSLLAIQIDGTLLYDVNKLKSKITDEQYFEICKQAVKSSYWNVFNIVIPDNMTNEQYYEICELAVTKYGTILEYVIAKQMKQEQYYKICKLAVKKTAIALQFVNTDYMTDYQNQTICKLALESLQDLDNLSNEDIYNTFLVAVRIDGNLLYNVNKSIIDSKFNITYKQYFKICEKALEQNREASNYIISKKDYNNLLSLTIYQSGGSNYSYSYSYNYDEFFKLMKKESEDLQMFNLYKMILNKIINEYNKNNKIDEFEAILYGALATGQDPSKVPILLEILKISILDKDKQTILLSYNKKDRKKMLDKYSNKDVLTQIEQKIKYFYDLYKKEEAYIQQRILKLDSEYRKKLLKFDNPEKIKYIIKNLIDNKIKELFDNSDLSNLYSLNIYDLMDYLDKYIKKSSKQLKKTSRVKKSSNKQHKKNKKQ